MTGESNEEGASQTEEQNEFPGLDFVKDSFYECDISSDYHNLLSQDIHGESGKGWKKTWQVFKIK